MRNDRAYLTGLTHFKNKWLTGREIQKLTITQTINPYKDAIKLSFLKMIQQNWQGLIRLLEKYLASGIFSRSCIFESKGRL